ncbi:MAG: hypothetical protein A3G40_06515 [Deltaproteobacteria bacterium RIFCSPLOWO2_12_FULL_57_22]|nr:MAG: hypothetical protein A3G40_06515 [Deltaproteobacteria bacterium RIFCSPLOWO2_12_FULL_57_22]
MRIRNLLLELVSIIALLLIACPAGVQASNAHVEVWKDEGFLEKVQALKKENWNKATSRDVAMIGLYEMGTALDRFEGRLQSGMDRLYLFAYWGSWAIGAYFVLQMILSLAVIIRLGRRPPVQSGTHRTPPEENFQL